jgi:hypothetical protein
VTDQKTSLEGIQYATARRGLTNYSFIWHSLMIIDELAGSQLVIIND